MLAGTGGDEAGGAAGSAAGSGPDACDVDVTLTVTTFNIRYDSGSGSGEDAWNASVNPRRERVLATITASSSDVVGVQEALANQVDDLTSSLDDFDFFGVGRDDGMRAGEFSGIFYRRARLERIDGGHFWLSETPEVPGTVFSGSGSIRMASWLVLRDRVTTRDFLLLNTHWDNVSQTSREQSALLIRERLSSLGAGLPEVLTGDLNQAESNVAVTTLTSPEPDGAGLIDAYRAVHRTRAPDERTFHDFTGETTGERIDFVLHSAGFVPLSAVIDRSQFDGRFASDHFAVTVTLGWAPDAARCDESADDSD
jgi:endonuclease/exonuclease/phosphatase family metal-dependent hydrolase